MHKPREEHCRIPSYRAGLSLFLRYLPPPREARPAKVVLYVHGGTFPSGLSIVHRFDGRSWGDELASAEFHCWKLDFHGFAGLSDPYPEMAEPAENHAQLGRAEHASRQLELAVRYICAMHSADRISLIAHSWGSIVSGRFADRCPELVERLLFFGPIASRAPREERRRLPAWRFISLKEQWNRFVADVPPGEPPVLSKRHLTSGAALISMPTPKAGHVHLPRLRRQAGRFRTFTMRGRASLRTIQGSCGRRWSSFAANGTA